MHLIYTVGLFSKCICYAINGLESEILLLSWALFHKFSHDCNVSQRFTITLICTIFYLL